ncbi:ZIP zinc transporter domain-containing protein [Sarocladium implicatum]|nr:ZIP zinc transporter domain-containing protein [Sarocladium implicatum]
MDDSMQSRDASWATVSTDLLLAELRRRGEDDGKKPTCGSKDGGWYDTAAHIVALVIILVVSTLSCAFPLVSKRALANNKRSKTILGHLQFAGTGVVLATCFCHLLPTAFESLTDPCLPDAILAYPPLPGAIVLVSSIIVIGLESYLTTKGAGHSHNHTHDFWDEDSDVQTELVSRPARSGSVGDRRRGGRPADLALEDMEASEGLVAGVSPLPVTSGQSSKPQNGHPRDMDFDDGDSDLDLDMDELDPTSGPSNRTGPYASLKPDDDHRQSFPHAHGGDDTEQQRQLLQCLLLEAGILFHSVFIGMAISVATGPAFIIFLIAISFHQCFEGIALGGRIAAIKFPRRSIRPWLMVLAFGITTPVGQAIGLAVHELYDPQSMGGLLVVGIMNGISSGLLIYAAFVQLLYEDFLSEDSYKVLRGKKRLHAYIAITAGAFLMAAVGAFA